MTAIHAAARLGFSREAQAYVRGRPEYPAALLPWLTDDLGVAPGKVVVELGAGTGKFTKLLVDTGAHVIAVEPVAAMRAQRASILPGVQQLPGIAEAIPLAGGGSRCAGLRAGFSLVCHRTGAVVIRISACRDGAGGDS